MIDDRRPPEVDEQLPAAERYRRAEDYVFSLISGPPTPAPGSTPEQIRRRARLRIERMGAFLEFIGAPHRRYRAIHVGGTSGKGSTATFITSILSAAGYRTGLHVSPYLQVATEKLVVGDRIASARRYDELVRTLAERAESWVHAGNDPLTYGEFWVAMSFLFLAEERVEVGVVEVGAGGRFDLTNVIEPEVVALTSVGLDHTTTLGDTIEEIAWHKAGIIKPGTSAVTAVRDPRALAVIEREARASSATLVTVSDPEDYRLLDVGPHGTSFLDVASGRTLRVQLPGAFQAANAATAVAAVRALRDVNISTGAIARGLEAARFPGRMEIVQSRPLVLLDGAHNPQKVDGFAANLRAIVGPRRTIAVFGVLESKSYQDMLDTLAPHVSTLVATSPKVFAKPPVEAAEIARRARDLIDDVYVEPDPLAAVDLALNLAEPNDAIIVTGSLYLVGNVRERWYPTDRILSQGTMWPAGDQLRQANSSATGPKSFAGDRTL